MTMTTYSQQGFIILMVSSKDLEVRSANDFIKGLLYNEFCSNLFSEPDILI